MVGQNSDKVTRNHIPPVWFEGGWMEMTRQAGQVEGQIWRAVAGFTTRSTQTPVL